MKVAEFKEVFPCLAHLSCGLIIAAKLIGSLFVVGSRALCRLGTSNGVCDGFFIADWLRCCALFKHLVRQRLPWWNILTCLLRAG